MKNVTPKWFLNVILFLFGISGISLSVLYAIDLSYAFILLHANVGNFAIFLGFLMQLFIVTISGILMLLASYWLFKRENGKEANLSEYLSVTHFKSVLNNLSRKKGKLSTKEKELFSQNWRLSYYKSLTAMGLFLLFFAIVIGIPISYNQYYPNLYQYNPVLFLTINNLYTFSVFVVVFSFLLSAFYILSVDYYKLPRQDRIKFLVTYHLRLGSKISRRNGFVPIPQRNQIHSDLRLIKMLVKSLDLEGFNTEERYGVIEFYKNLKNFDNFLICSNKTAFTAVSAIFKKTLVSLFDESQPQIFLRNYYGLREKYKSLRKGYRAQFNTNELFEMQKGLTWYRIRGEISSLKFTNILSIVIVIIIFILFVIKILFFPSLPLPTIPGL